MSEKRAPTSKVVAHFSLFRSEFSLLKQFSVLFYLASTSYARILVTVVPKLSKLKRFEKFQKVFVRNQ